MSSLNLVIIINIKYCIWQLLKKLYSNCSKLSIFATPAAHNISFPVIRGKYDLLLNKNIAIDSNREMFKQNDQELLDKENIY